MKRSTLLLVLPLFLLLACARTAPAETCSGVGFNKRADFPLWKDGMKTLGVDAGEIVNDDNPTADGLKKVFARSDEWLYLAGHFSGGRMYNQNEKVGITFREDRVILDVNGSSEELKKDAGFNQHKKLKVLFWGGCETHGSDAMVATLRKLFGTAAVQVGWKGTTGWEMPFVNMGGTIGSKHFDTNFFTLMNGSKDRDKVKDAWLKSADAIYWGKSEKPPLGPFRPRFSVIDANGQQYLLKGELDTNQGQVKGTKY